MITLSIDVTRLDKERFKEFTRADGTKGKSCELVIFDTAKGPIVKQQVTKAEREARIDMPILGNAKNWDTTAPSSRRSSDKPSSAPAASGPPVGDDVPF